MRRFMSQVDLEGHQSFPWVATHQVPGEGPYGRATCHGLGEQCPHGDMLGLEDKSLVLTALPLPSILPHCSAAEPEQRLLSHEC